MTLREASTRFLEHLKLENSHAEDESNSQAQTLEHLTSYMPEARLSELTPARLRDFIARWYVEQTNHTPVPEALLVSLAEFLKWIDTNAGSTLAESCQPVIEDLRESLPRALEITAALSTHVRARGAFGFPEFLTSFEEGGSSEYDLGAGGSVGAVDGYFRISRIEGTNVEAEELVSDERVWPVIFPAEAAPLLDTGYIINLEVVRRSDGWHIAACGFAYPPGTEF
jgi:hypothetical protein